MDSATNFMSETLNNVLSMDKIEEGEIGMKKDRKEGLKEVIKVERKEDRRKEWMKEGRKD